MTMCRRSSRKTVRANCFLLSMASPVLHKMISGSFIEGTTRQLSLEDVDATAFDQILNLWCGKEERAGQLGDVMEMASVADRLEMLDVLAVLEAVIISELRPEVCAEVLMSSRRVGLRMVEEAAWGMAVRQFDEVCRTAGFMVLDEATVGRLLDDDGLGVRKEEEAFEGLVGWMKGDTLGGLRGRELLQSIRFGVMEERYLEEIVHWIVPEEHREWMEGLVGDALRAKAAVRAKATVEVGRLGTKALTRRRGRGVDWRRYCEGGGGRRLQGHSGDVRALEVCEGRLCSGSEDGSIRVWRLDTLEEERVMLNERGEPEEGLNVTLIVFFPWRYGRVCLSAGIGLGWCACGMWALANGGGSSGATLGVFDCFALWGRAWRADQPTIRSRCGRWGRGPSGRARGR